MTNCKKVALAVSSALAFSFAMSAAHAADVTVYGKVETALHFQYKDFKDADSDTQFSLDNGGSRFGFNINEQINEDWAIKGYLENGFNIDDGGFTTSGTLFDRRCILAVKSKTYGEFGFGRMGSVVSTYGPYARGLALLDPFETGYTSEYSISGAFLNDPGRSNNAFTWLSPNWAGLQLGFTYSLGVDAQEEVNEDDNTRLIAASMNYQAGPALLVLAASQTMWANKTGSGANYDGTTERNDTQQVTVGVNWAATDTLKLYAAAQWMKDARTYGKWKATEYSYNSDTKKETQASENGIDGMNYLVGFRYMPTGNATLIGSYRYFDGEQDVEGAADLEGKSHSVAFGLEYDLSKTTMVYAVGSYRKLEDQVAKVNGGLENYWTAMVGLQKWF